MGAISLADARADVRFIIGGYTSAELSDAVVDRWLRFALLHVARPGVHPHRELHTSGTFALVTADRDYAFSTFGTSTDNVQAVRLVVNESRNKRMSRLSLRQMEERARGGSGVLVTGLPTHYNVDGGTLYVYPAPAAANNGNTVRVWYTRKPAALAASPAHELAEDWDEVIIRGAVWRGFVYLNLMERAEIAKGEFGQLVNDVNDRLRIDMLEDPADSGFEVDIRDYQQESF